MNIKFTAKTTIINGTVAQDDHKEREKLALMLKRTLGLFGE